MDQDPDRDRDRDPDSGSAEAEFDVSARWTVESIERCGQACAVPAACRGSGGPAAFQWLAEHLITRPDLAFLDAGAGLGGPAAWLAEHHDVRPAVAEPMKGAATGSRRLFGLPAVVATAQDLPFPSACFDAVWALGVLSTTGEQPEALAEIRRVLACDGRAGLVVWVATDGAADIGPAKDHFPTWPALEAMIDQSDFELIDAVAVDDLAATPAAWAHRAKRVEDDAEARHGDDDRWQDARADQDCVTELIDRGHVRGHALRLVPHRPR